MLYFLVNLERAEEARIDFDNVPTAPHALSTFLGSRLTPGADYRVFSDTDLLSTEKLTEYRTFRENPNYVELTAQSS